MLIATQKNGQAGFTIIEMMIAVAVLGLLAAVALPSFQIMLTNSRVRNGAEAISNGLQRARAEAVARNTRVAFAMLEDYEKWQITVVADGFEIETYESEGAKNVNVVTDPPNSSVVTFSNIGRRVANADASDPVNRLDITADGATDGTTASLRITIGGGGNIRMCDRNLVAGTSPRACE